MMRLVLFVLVVAACWYGWKHYGELRSGGTNELQVLNHSGFAIERLRLTVGDETAVVETLEDGATANLPWVGKSEGSFTLLYNVRGREGDRHWTGGGFQPSPALVREVFEFTPDDHIVWREEPKLVKGAGASATH